MSPSNMMAAGLLVLGTGVLGLPQMGLNQKHIDNTKTVVAVDRMEAMVAGTTDKHVKTNLLTRASNCDQHKFNLTFDDVTIPADERKAYSQSPHKMAGGFYWSAGFVTRPGKPEAAQAVSQPNLMSYQPDLDTLTKDSRAEMTTLNEQRFNVYGAHLGCQDPRAKEDDCHMTLFGLRDGKQVAKRDFEHIPSCGHECVLKRFELGEHFRNLTSLQFRAKDDGKPQWFAMDNLELEYVKDDCQAAAIEVAAGQPISTSIVEPTAVPLVEIPSFSSVSKVTKVTVTYKPTITKTSTATVTPVVFVPSYTPTTTITLPETLMHSSTVVAKTTTMTVDGAVETLVCDTDTLIARDGSACAGIQQRDICESFPFTMTFEPSDLDKFYYNPLDMYALDMYDGWSIVPASDTPFTNAESQAFLKFAPMSSAPEDAFAAVEHGLVPVFNATSAFLGCTHPDKDDDCNVIAEGYVPGADMVTEEFTIPACALGQEKSCELQYHHFPDSFSGLTRLVFHVKDSGKAQTFWLDNLSLATKFC